MKYKFYLEQKLYPDHVLARLLTEAEAKALHYKDGFREENEHYLILVIGFESEEKAMRYIAGLKSFFFVGW